MVLYTSTQRSGVHLLNKHKEIDDEERLREAIREALLSGVSTGDTVMGGKYGNPTIGKIGSD